MTYRENCSIHGMKETKSTVGEMGMTIGGTLSYIMFVIVTTLSIIF